MNRTDPALRGYALCGEARAGTTFLKELLASTGRLGEPVEWFDPVWRARVGPTDDFIGAMLARTATPNSVYGLKIFSSHAKAAARHQWATRLPNLSFVHIRRDDLLGQAISFARAAQTARFVSDQAERRAAGYDRRAIDSALITLARGQARWEIWFARHGIAPLRVSYEQVIADPADTVARIAALVGVEGARIDLAQVTAQRMSDDTSDEWRHRYRADAPSADRLPGLTDRSPKAVTDALRTALR
ncbi:MAG: hypothetical protein E7773_10620 [Sphingomonas sp.]|uniref:Stf0 family sulfotransferase n=1 Tax=Sphingomonas sp. TaxID=28214 RepID=UPI001225A64E|nr:Stf0 family sulfotransferase [Sphingomonas sp.]THD35560.1 MAG: hypothetical protein E7773_10620 [Sphingomonas sp.]